MSKNKFFTNQKRNIVLYDYKKKLMVTTKFRVCKTTDYNEALYCTCGLYVRVNEKKSHFVYIDYCNVQDVAANLNFKYYNSETQRNRNLYEYMNCSTEFESEKNENWDKVPISFNYFKCARLITPFAETYLVNI